MPDDIQLYSNRLQVTLSFPGSAYQGSRFDWTGFITQVTLDGSHTFCVPESLQPGAGSGGSGLCNEFGIDQPVGYDDARPGELFPKLGIGLLRRPDGDAYSFSRPYEVVQPFPVQMATGPDQAVISVEPLDCRGYAARLIKTIHVRENRLEIAYELENTGKKAILTHEYVHNFVGINRQPIGPDYRLRFPYPLNLDGEASAGLDVLAIQESEIAFTGPLPGLYLRPQGYTRSDTPQWEMLHQSSGAGLREVDDFMPLRVAVWGTFHVLSPEIFVGLSLPPRARQAWTRRFEFFDMGFEEGPHFGSGVDAAAGFTDRDGRAPRPGVSPAGNGVEHDLGRRLAAGVALTGVVPTSR